MPNYMIENPWNEYLEKFVSNSNDRKVKKLIVLKSEENIHLFQSLPAKFQKLKDLVLCNNCEILVSRRNCLFHTKFHENSDGLFLPYNAFPSDDHIYIPSRIKNHALSNVASEKVSLNLPKEKKRKIIKTPKQSKYINENQITLNHSIIENPTPKIEENTNFIPKTILNSLDPLKLKIRLQPKISSSEKLCVKNGNIFDNLTSYCNDIKKNHPLKSARVRSLEELVGEKRICDDIVLSTDEEEINQSELSTTRRRRDSIRNVFSAENILKIRRMDVTGEPGFHARMSLKSPNNSPPHAMPVAIPIVAKRAMTTISNPIKSNNYPISSLPIRSPWTHQAQEPPPSQSNNVFQNYGNRIIRINGQRKCVRIQQLEDNPSNWQRSASDKPLTNFHNHEATQKQFQRRLLQQGVISENDIIRCARSNTESDPGQRRKVTIVNGSITSNDSCIQVLRRPGPASNISAGSFPSYKRIVESQNRRLPEQQANQRNIVYNRVVLEKTNSLSLPQPVHNSKSRSCQNVSNMELSDEEFILDPQYQNPHNDSGSYVPSVHNNTGPTQYHPNILLNNDSSSKLSNIKSYQKSDPEIFSHTYREDESSDPTIHFLPSPGRQIMDLPWDI